MSGEEKVCSKVLSRFCAEALVFEWDGKLWWKFVAMMTRNFGSFEGDLMQF
jgi:hypothetical protein